MFVCIVSEFLLACHHLFYCYCKFDPITFLDTCLFLSFKVHVDIYIYIYNYINLFSWRLDFFFTKTIQTWTLFRIASKNSKMLLIISMNLNIWCLISYAFLSSSLRFRVEMPYFFLSIVICNHFSVRFFPCLSFQVLLSSCNHLYPGSEGSLLCIIRLVE